MLRKACQIIGCRVSHAAKITHSLFEDVCQALLSTIEMEPAYDDSATARIKRKAFQKLLRSKLDQFGY